MSNRINPMADRVNDGLGVRQEMDRHWFLTWTTYGTWLPGDQRGFVSNIDRGDGRGHRINQPGTEPAAEIPSLERHARSRMKGSPVYLNMDHALALWHQFKETSRVRGWQLEGVAIMPNHVHIVVGVLGDPDPKSLLRDFKSYGSRKLNQAWPRPESGTWWTESGSTRKLPDEQAVASAVAYVRDQEFPLFVWIHPLWEEELGPRRERRPGERRP